MNGGEDGIAEVIPSGGTPGYTYLWSNGASTAKVTGLRASTYSILITDANGCSRTLSNIVIAEPPAAQPPTARDSNFTVAYGTSSDIPLNLSGTPATSLVLVSAALHGSVIVNGTTTTYTPAPGYVGSDSFTYTASNGVLTSAPATVTIIVTAPTIRVDSSSLPNSMVDIAYSQVITASGGLAPYHYSITAGAMPLGLYLNASGTFSGTPTIAGTYNFTVTAADSGTGAGAPYKGTRTYSLTVEASATTPQTITFTNPGGQNLGTTPTLIASSTSNLLVTFSSSTTGVCTITSGGALMFISAGTCTINANQAGNGAYSAALQVSQSFTVNAAAPLPAITINDVTQTEGNGGTKAFTFTVSLSAPSAQSVTVNYATADGTAQAGTDYIAASGTLVFTPGMTTATANILVNGDIDVETNETFFVNLTNSGNATMADGQGVGTILNDDAAVSVPAITPSPALPSAVQGNVYTHTFTAAGGTAPYTFSGVMPSGWTLSPLGMLSGTPTSAGSLNFTVYVQDAASTVSAPVAFTLNVLSAAQLPLPNKTVSVAAGATAEIDLTMGVAGGPFSSATAQSLSPSTAGVASIVSNGGTHSLRFVPAAGFAGVATVQYLLQGASPMHPGTVTITVAARTNVAQDADVTGLAAAQTSAAQRFASAQITNFTQRLESLHGGGWGQSSFGLSLTSDDARKVVARNGNGVADSIVGSNPLRNGMRNVGLKAKRAAHAEPAAALPNLSEGSAEHARSPWAFWVNGTISYGRERHRDADERYRFTTNGISAGVDYRINSWITVGTGLGLSSDSSRVGNNGTRSTTDSTVAVAYASMRPMQGVFVDVLLGYGVLNFDSHRYITTTGDMAAGSRDGTQLFGSIATGLEFNRTGWMWSPYARLEFSQAKLDAYTENGPTSHALKYFEQTANITNGVLGARTEGKLAVRWGSFMPQVRVEYARRFEEDNEAGLTYADLTDQGPAYTLRGRRMDTGRWTVGFGGRLLLRNGVELGAEYTTNIDQRNAYVGSLRLGARVPF